jgi:hypothetical protein
MISHYAFVKSPGSLYNSQGPHVMGVPGSRLPHDTLLLTHLTQAFHHLLSIP